MQIALTFLRLPLDYIAVPVEGFVLCFICFRKQTTQTRYRHGNIVSICIYVQMYIHVSVGRKQRQVQIGKT